MEIENKLTAKLNNKYFKVKNFTHFVRCFMKIDNKGLVQTRGFSKNNNQIKLNHLLKQIAGEYFLKEKINLKKETLLNGCL